MLFISLEFLLLFLPLTLATPHVDDIGQRLERVEVDACRQDHLEPAEGGPKSCSPTRCLGAARTTFAAPSAGGPSVPDLRLVAGRSRLKKIRKAASFSSQMEASGMIGHSPKLGEGSERGGRPGRDEHSERGPRLPVERGTASAAGAP